MVNDRNGYIQALSDYNKAINIDPQYGFCYWCRALCYFQLGNVNAAINDLQVGSSLGDLESINTLQIVNAQLNKQCQSNSSNYVCNMSGLEERFGFKPGTLKNYHQ